MQESRTPNYSRKGSWQHLQDHWGYHPKLLPHQDVSRPGNPRKTPNTQCEKDIFWWFSTKAYLPHRKKLWGLACCWISGSKPGTWLVEKSKVSGCLLVHSQKQFEQLSKIKIEPVTPRQNDSPQKMAANGKQQCSKKTTWEAWQINCDEQWWTSWECAWKLDHCNRPGVNCFGKSVWLQKDSNDMIHQHSIKFQPLPNQPAFSSSGRFFFSFVP